MWQMIKIATRSREEFVEITATIRGLLEESGVKNGVCYVYIPHTTAGVTINENADPDVILDLNRGLERLVPTTGDYHHREGNSAAHIKAALLGSSVAVPVVDGRLALGTWQGIYFCEFDGPRSRSYQVGFFEMKE
ncbi:MAG TPA: secondary thiamine-phosphate synthase enzyme YjbQ [Bacillota bacterium]